MEETPFVAPAAQVDAEYAEHRQKLMEAARPPEPDDAEGEVPPAVIADPVGHSAAANKQQVKTGVEIEKDLIARSDAHGRQSRERTPRSWSLRHKAMVGTARALLPISSTILPNVRRRATCYASILAHDTKW